LTLCNTSSFFTRSVHLIFSILLQHQISKISRYINTVYSIKIKRYVGVYWYDYHTKLHENSPIFS
jgi:hypothetical protein